MPIMSLRVGNASVAQHSLIHRCLFVWNSTATLELGGSSSNTTFLVNHSAYSYCRKRVASYYNEISVYMASKLFYVRIYMNIKMFSLFPILAPCVVLWELDENIVF